MALNNRYCCEAMTNVIEEKKSSLKYDGETRTYYVLDEYSPSMRDITYCPWCGTKLPKALDEELEEILEKEYGLTDTWEGGKDYDKIPDEFRTDEWWKKRGL